MRSQEGEGKSAPDGAGCGGGGGCPTCGWGAVGKGMEDGSRSGEGGVGHLCYKVHSCEPSTSFPGKRKAEHGHCWYPSLRSPSCTRCSVVGLASTEGSPALGFALHPAHGRAVVFPAVVFPSWQSRSRAALTQTPDWYGRVCTAICEAAGNFTCRCRSLIMTQALKIWSSKNGPFPLWGCGMQIQTWSKPITQIGQHAHQSSVV